MIIEYILIGFILLIFLVDILKKNNNKSSDVNKVEINDNESNWFLSFLIIILIGLVIGVAVDYTINNNTYSEDIFLYVKEFRFTYAALSNYLISLLITLILGVYLVSFKYPNFRADLLKRKKNLTLSFISIPLLKVLMHYFFFPERTSTTNFRSLMSREYVLGNSRKEDFGHHIELIFEEHLLLFIPSFFIVLLFAWLFNDKIKAR